MSTRLTQAEFDVAATAWTAFVGSATAYEVQSLFQSPPPKPTEPLDAFAAPIQYQTFVSFDLADTISHLLSTVGIQRVMASFVLVPNPLASTPRFCIVLYATDSQGGRISAYYRGDSDYHVIPPPKSESASPDLQTLGAPQGLVPFSLISNWLNAWVTAAKAQKLSPAQFATHYGPLQGYNFELGDFMDQLFTARASPTQPGATQLRLNFGLKTYFPAYPETLTTPVQTFGLVVRLFRPYEDSDGSGGGTESGPSYDVAKPYPPG